MRVLIVDDNRRMRELLRTILRELKVEFCEAANGEHALEMYSIHHPDIVLMDIRIPGIDGIEATRKIMQDNPASNVVIVTEFDNHDLRRKAMEAGAIAYVLKDNLRELPDTLADLMHLN